MMIFTGTDGTKFYVRPERILTWYVTTEFQVVLVIGSGSAISQIQVQETEQDVLAKPGMPQVIE